MYLSYSGHKKFLSCPRSYWHGYVNKTKIDPENRVNMLYGSVVGLLFEDFYNKKLWRQSDVEDQLQTEVIPKLRSTISSETKRGGIIRYKGEDEKATYGSEQDLIADIRAAIPNGLQIIRQHRLLGTDGAAEVKLDSFIEGHMIGGRADFIVTRTPPYKDLVILDGKGSKHRDTYVDVRQLMWYAMLQEKKTGSYPDRLGFVFWRSAPDQGVDWHDVKRNDIERLKSRVLSSIEDIETGVETMKSQRSGTQGFKLAMAEAFPALPGSGCKLCSYVKLCPTGEAYIAKSTTDDGVPGVVLD